MPHRNREHRAYRRRRAGSRASHTVDRRQRGSGQGSGSRCAVDQDSGAGELDRCVMCVDHSPAVFASASRVRNYTIPRDARELRYPTLPLEIDYFRRPHFFSRFRPRPYRARQTPDTRRLSPHCIAPAPRCTLSAAAPSNLRHRMGADSTPDLNPTLPGRVEVRVRVIRVIRVRGRGRGSVRVRIRVRGRGSVRVRVRVTVRVRVRVTWPWH